MSDDREPVECCKCHQSMSLDNGCEWGDSERLYCWGCAHDEIERLQGIVGQLPKDAEGNAVYPGRELVSTYYGSIQQPRTVNEIWADGWTLGGSTKYRHDDTGRPCYGIIDAAEKARKP
jgi:hypothetical protein